MSATTASHSGTSRDAAALASGIASAKTTPRGLRALLSGVLVVHRPMSPIFTPPSSTVVVRGRWSRNAPALASSVWSNGCATEDSGCGTPPRPSSAFSSAASAARALSSRSAPRGQANTFVLTTSHSSSAILWPRVSMLWSNSWFPRHACVTGTAFIALTAAAPRSSEESRDGDKKSPLSVQMNASPGSRLSWMKHFRALRLCSS